MSLTHLSLFALVGLLTHLVVFVIGVSGSLGLLPLARGRRSGLGLVLMAIAMVLFTLPPRSLPDWVVAAAYVVAFAVALWLILGPTRLPPNGHGASYSMPHDDHVQKSHLPR